MFKLKTNISVPNELDIVGKYSICMRWLQIFWGGGIYCDKQKCRKNQDLKGIHLNMLKYNVEV